MLTNRLRTSMGALAIVTIAAGEFYPHVVYGFLSYTLVAMVLAPTSVYLSNPDLRKYVFELSMSVLTN